MQRLVLSSFTSLGRITLAAAGLSLLLAAGCDDDNDLPGAKPTDAGADKPPAADATADAVAPVDAAGTVDTATPDGSASEGGVTPDAGTADGGTDVAPPPPPDLDFAVVRFNANGTLDTTFGAGGIARIDLGPGAGTTRDSHYGLAGDAQGRLVLFGAKKGDGRSDSDRVVVRLTPTGAIDTTFATMGVHTLNLANLGDSARNGIIDPDGKIVAAGYAAQPTGVGLQTANRIVLLRLLDNGMPDPAFGTAGIVNSAPFVPAMPDTTMWGMAEAYGVVRQSTGSYVTTGYGRSAATGTVDVVSFRFGPDGKRDNTWGAAGASVVDIAGDNDRGRNLIALPGDRILVVGSGSPAAMTIDGLAMILQANGTLDPTFDTDGHKLYDFGRPDEAFFGVAVAPGGNLALATGYRTGAVGGVTEDDDATLLLLPVGPAGGAEIVKAVPISETESDRFFSAAFDAGGKAYGAGFVRAGNDSQMVVARYLPDGMPDATFGTAGVAKVNVVVNGGTEESARAVIVQADGKVVIAGNVEVVKP
jgi:uncharacterized delta-60 repeat protein